MEVRRRLRALEETGSRLWCCEECRKEDKHFKGGFRSDRLLPPRRPSPPAFRHDAAHNGRPRDAGGFRAAAPGAGGLRAGGVGR